MECNNFEQNKGSWKLFQLVSKENVCYTRKSLFFSFYNHLYVDKCRLIAEVCSILFLMCASHNFSSSPMYTIYIFIIIYCMVWKDLNFSIKKFFSPFVNIFTRTNVIWQPILCNFWCNIIADSPNAYTVL